MCHGAPSPSFPAPEVRGEVAAEVQALVFGEESAGKTVAIIPDIFGLNQFYRGFATYLAGKGTKVYLTNPFAGLDPLPEVTREAAFARRHKVRDKAFVDALEAFCGSHAVDGVVGFCLGGLYVFELARRGVPQALVGLYGFPQGLPNQDPLPVPFDYLADVGKRQTCLMPGRDQSVGVENIARLEEIARQNPAIDLHVYAQSGHGFLTDLDSEDGQLRGHAQDALRRCEQALGLA